MAQHAAPAPRSGAVGAGPPVIVFVGGGAGATLAVVALLRATTWLRLSYRVLMVDEFGRHGRGASYTPGPAGPGSGPDLVEAPVKAMSALPDRPCHPLEWARSQGLAWRPDTFALRGAYGDYLADTLASTSEWAAPYAEVGRRTERVDRLCPHRTGVGVFLAEGGRLEAAAAVVATGDPRTSPPPRLVDEALRPLAVPHGAQERGLATCERGAVLTAPGGAQPRLFALGSVRPGPRPAPVPRLREQAEHLAQAIADTVLRRRGRGAGAVRP